MTYYELPDNLQQAYARLDTESKFCDLAWDGKGPSRVLRFKANPLMKYVEKTVDLNRMWEEALRSHWPVEVMRRYSKMPRTQTNTDDIRIEDEGDLQQNHRYSEVRIVVGEQKLQLTVQQFDDLYAAIMLHIESARDAAQDRFMNS